MGIIPEFRKEKTMCKCVVCGKKVEDILIYRLMAEEEGLTPEEFVINNEGTYNREKDIFCCDGCYIKIGMPLGKAKLSWKR